MTRAEEKAKTTEERFEAILARVNGTCQKVNGGKKAKAG